MVLTSSREEDKIEVNHLVNAGKVFPWVPKRTSPIQGNLEEEEAVGAQVVFDNLVPQKKRKLYDRTSLDSYDEMESRLENDLNDSYIKTLQQVEASQASRIDRMKVQLNQFQSHAISLERQLQEARETIKILCSNVGDLIKLHANGQCECQKYFASHSDYIHRKLAISEETSLTPSLRNMKSENSSRRSHMDSFLYHSSFEVSKPNEQYKDASCMNSNIGKDNLQNASVVKGNEKEGAKVVFKEPSKETSSRYWTAKEHKRFLEALSQFGRRDLKALSDYVGTRSTVQCRTHMQKYFLRLMRESSNSEIRKPHEASL
ncbi:hypothetical protein GpartN1_g1653.t1 [Galdieria partita]|uniref:Uncharacterized protein n=1 Tax=Galdieria partita TaxID=83374 RepID=A0A9C7UNV4_9RHOD|nr:hypothetical protein GpartN1_g1653.t1 [Galdieria partita]